MSVPSYSVTLTRPADTLSHPMGVSMNGPFTTDDQNGETRPMILPLLGEREGEPGFQRHFDSRGMG
jgi:hypothetical protein